MDAAKQSFVLLVIECSPELDWYAVFRGATTFDGRAVHVEQVEWDDLSVVSYGNTIMCQARAAKHPLPNSTQSNARSFSPHFVLMRSVSRGTWGQDSTNKLFALMHSGLPAVNSLLSCYCFLEKPVVWSELKRIQQRLGKERFPLIDQTLYPSHREMIIAPEAPFVGKTGSAHAGKGKIRLTSRDQFEDYASLVALQPYFCTVEPFIEWDWDGRVQKIGNHYRVWKRQTTTWKGNSGRGAVIEEIPLTDELKQWADECAKMFGGVEILGLDFVHDKRTDKFVILELNDTAIGLVHRVEVEDMHFMRDVVLAKDQSLRGAEGAVSGLFGGTVPSELVLQEQVRRLILEKKELAEQLEHAKTAKKK